MLEKGPDQADVEILDRKVRRLSFKACGRKPQQECERVGISGDGCLLYTSDAADERSSVDLGGRRIIKKQKNQSRRR